MKTQVENISDVKKIIHFEIPWDEVDKHIKETVRQISRSARIPGFRPGKAPESLIRSRYAQHIKEDVINHLVPDAYKQALQENKFDLVSEPSLHDIMYSEGSPFLFKVTIETKPHIEVKDYKGLPLKGSHIHVRGEEVDAVLKGYQERAAELIPQDVAAQNGDYVHAHVKATIERAGKKQKLFDDRSLILVGSEENHAAFNENLTGKKAGETVEFEATYPEDYSEKAIAGKTIHYQVTIEKVNEKRIAPLDDEFAKDLGDFSSLEDLKEKVRKDVLRLKTSEQKSQFREDLLKQLIDLNPFEVPEALVNKETESLLHSYAHSLQQRGVDLENQKLDWKEIQARLSRQADQNVRGSLLVEAIASLENIQVIDEDVDRVIADMAEHQRRAPEAIKAELFKEEKMESLRHRILVNKTLDFLLEQAEIEYTDEESAEKKK